MSDTCPPPPPPALRSAAGRVASKQPTVLLSQDTSSGPSAESAERYVLSFSPPCNISISSLYALRKKKKRRSSSFLERRHGRSVFPPVRRATFRVFAVRRAARRHGARRCQASDDTDIRRGTLGIAFGTRHTHEAWDAACAPAARATSRPPAWRSEERTRQQGAIVPARHERHATHVARAGVFGSRFLVLSFAGVLTQLSSHLHAHRPTPCVQCNRQLN